MKIRLKDNEGWLIVEIKGDRAKVIRVFKTKPSITDNYIVDEIKKIIMTIKVAITGTKDFYNPEFIAGWVEGVLDGRYFSYMKNNKKLKGNIRNCEFISRNVYGPEWCTEYTAKKCNCKFTNVNNEDFLSEPDIVFFFLRNWNDSGNDKLINTFPNLQNIKRVYIPFKDEECLFKIKF